MKRTCCGALLLLATATLHADAPGVYAITGGTVHTVSGAEIANGTVIVRDGLIEAAGSGIAIPADAAVIDASGQHVYPGLIDAQTSIGFAAPRPRRSPFGGGGPPVPRSHRRDGHRCHRQVRDAGRWSWATSIRTRARTWPSTRTAI